MIDPRIQAIRERLKKIQLSIPVISPKGGVGKTFIATALALTLSYRGIPTGLLDFDITNPNTHVMLGIDVEKKFPEEEKGILPVVVEGVEFISIAFYTMDKALPLRGKHIDSAIKEILAITRWVKSKVLVVDTAPGISDEVLDSLHILVNVKPLIVSTASKTALISTRRIVELLRDIGFEPLGIVGNMCRDRDVETLSRFCKALGVELLTCIPYIDELENYIGSPRDIYSVASPYITTIADRISMVLNYGGPKH